jgi:hypothetical protein
MKENLVKTTVPENKLVLLVEESGLDKTKSQVLLEKFSDYFAIAAEWEVKAKTIVVTHAQQTEIMEIASVGRKFLKDKRCAVENTRKELKEASLREGKTIDSIATILKNLITPIEEYLKEQEDFIVIQEKKRKDERKAERVKELTALEYDYQFVDLFNMDDDSYASLITQINNAKSAKIEAERLEKEKKEAEEKAAKLYKERKEMLIPYWSYIKEGIASWDFSVLSEKEFNIVLEEAKKAKLKVDEETEKLRVQNEKLRKEAEIAKTKAIAEKAKQDAIIEQQRKDAQKKIDEERAKNEKLKAELKAKQEAENAELLKKQQAEKAAFEAAKAEKAAFEAAKKAAKAPEKEKLLNYMSGFSFVAIDTTDMSDKAVSIKKEIDAEFIGFCHWAKQLIDENLK